MNDTQRLVQEHIDELVATGAELGLQVAAYRDGELLVDAVAGVADVATGRAVTSGTPFFATSAGKGVVATVVHVLAEKGVLDYDRPIAELWPEFAANGKERVTLRQALVHTAGIPGVPPETTPEDLADWDRMAAIVAAAEPWWEPGTKTGYHALTFGWIVGEVIRRATGRELPEVLRDEVTGPLGVAEEIYFAVPEGRLGGLAVLEEPPGAAEMMASMPPDLPMFKTAPPALFPSAALYNRPGFLTANVLAGGTMTARAVARMYAALLGEVDGVRLISPARLAEVTAIAFTGVDQIFGNEATWGLGYTFENPVERPTTFGFTGAGGTVAHADTASGVTFALMRNTFSFGDLSAAERLAAVVTAADA
ncbi:serine hydrolase domain-containing protein [Phytomonospora endophytica]|uniref:CubicO group peptidase (Beta-lactamase class C family) n=1 Tax=Phytomonospora endophytica TaxID=714109 RepID=A0A841FAY3_9ACTN|nr:serine hydrolase domain-containing protein [Phytomonospora endophytica]MBB6034421.1 CubicO group peptidase (beta-lactamase class C family) [Phytomonospora endophytica]